MRFLLILLGLIFSGLWENRRPEKPNRDAGSPPPTGPPPSPTPNRPEWVQDLVDALDRTSRRPLSRFVREAVEADRERQRRKAARRTSVEPNAQDVLIQSSILLSALGPPSRVPDAGAPERCQIALEVARNSGVDPRAVYERARRMVGGEQLPPYEEIAPKE